MSKISDEVMTFPGAGTREFQSIGRFLRIRSSSSAVFISVDGRPELEREQGEQIDLGREGVRVRVRSTIGQTVKVISSADRQDDNRSTLNATVNSTVEPGNNNIPSNDVSILANASGVLVAADVNRKTLLVSLDPDQPIEGIRIGDATVAAGRGYWLGPGAGVEIPTEAAVHARNLSATTSVSVNILSVGRV